MTTEGNRPQPEAKKVLTTAEEIAQLEKEMAQLEARLYQVRDRLGYLTRLSHGLITSREETERAQREFEASFTRAEQNQRALQETIHAEAEESRQRNEERAERIKQRQAEEFERIERLNRQTRILG